MKIDEKKYLKNPYRCPKCESEQISGGPVEVDDGGAWQEITCDECNFEWADIYKLTGVEAR